MRLTISSSPSSSSASPPATFTRRYHSHDPSLLIPDTLSLCQLPNNDPNPHSKPKTIRYRLGWVCQQGKIHLARQMFDTIPRPTTVLWNTLIIGFICNNMPEEAILLYSRMKSSSFQGEPYMYSAVLKACAETRDVRVGKAVHCYILCTHLYSSRVVCNSLMNMNAASLDSEMGSVDLVREVFNSMRKRNVVSWDTLISWNVKVGDL